jgi:hypothetical protein
MNWVWFCLAVVNMYLVLYALWVALGEPTSPRVLCKTYTISTGRNELTERLTDYALPLVWPASRRLALTQVGLFFWVGHLVQA